LFKKEKKEKHKYIFQGIFPVSFPLQLSKSENDRHKIHYNTQSKEGQLTYKCPIWPVRLVNFLRRWSTYSFLEAQILSVLNLYTGFVQFPPHREHGATPL